MHENLGYLFAAFAVTWVALFGYIFYVHRLMNETSARLHALEEAAGEDAHTG
jgi:CcmD family protein